MSKTAPTILELEDGGAIRTAGIKFIEAVTDEDRTATGEKYGVDASEFQTKLRMVDGSVSLLKETMRQIDEKIGLVNLDEKGRERARIVPASNIPARPEPFTDKIAERMQARRTEQGLEPLDLSRGFKSTVQMPGGMALSVHSPAELLTQVEAAISRVRPAARPS